MRPELLFVIAFAFYSVAIWSHVRSQTLSPLIIGVFAGGLTADIVGTMWCFSLSKGFSWSFHAIAGAVALSIMTLHFTWALLARIYAGACESYFTRYSRTAWVVWTISFLSGIPLTHF